MVHEKLNAPDGTELNGLPDENLAGDLVLGLLSGAALEAAERRESEDPVFAQLVLAWRQRLRIPPDSIEPVTPPDDMWDRISGAIDKEG